MTLVSTNEDYLQCKKWKKLFPASVANREASAVFLSRALFVAFSVIMKRRGLLNDSCFAQNYITENMKASTLNFQNPTSGQIAELLRDVGVSIKKGHVEEVALVISEKVQEEQALEVYTWKILYDEHGIPSAILQQGDSEDAASWKQLASLEYRGTASVRDQLILMVKSLYYLVGKILRPLPKKYSFNFRVKYMEDCPPEDSIPGFGDSDIYYTEHPQMQFANVGSLRAGHLSSSLVCKSVCIDDSFAAEKALLRVNKNLAKNMDNGDTLVNDSMYSSMAQEEAASPEPVMLKTATVPIHKETSEDEKVDVRVEEDQLASSVAKIALENEKITTKTRGRGRKAAAKKQPVVLSPSHPYARIGSVKVMQTPPR